MSQRPSRKRAFSGVVPLAVALLVATAPLAATEAESEPGATEAAAAATHGVVVTWDRESGRFRPPTPAQLAKITEAFQRMFGPPAQAGEGGLEATEEVVVERLANGSVKARLPLSHMHASVVRFGRTGELVNACTDSPRRAQELLNRPAPAPTVVEE